jgi:hypothetical protein
MIRRDGHRWVIDGIEEGMARIEEDGERIITVPLHLLPADVAEGQMLRVISAPGAEPGSLVVTVSIDEKATAQALEKSKAAMARTMSASKKRDRGGDVAL